MFDWVPKYVWERLHTIYAGTMRSTVHKKKQFRQRIGLGMKFPFLREDETNISFNPLSANPTK